ncbi:hypothetical protein V6N11_057966 [Hibiscus sabdariffa]|uniref:Uncharacterized protein n=1 Tax=Hibiscus sabdariffa TaxID=183260 RepID=A0ABR2P449_9ROSI
MIPVTGTHTKSSSFRLFTPLNLWIHNNSPIMVEYRDHSLGLMQFAQTEAPNEALPLSCRPNFGAAWLTKDKFKVNETYDCWYISGIPTVKLYSDGFFSCKAKDPSLIEMMKRYFIISTKILRSWFSDEGSTRYLGQEIKAAERFPSFTVCVLFYFYAFSVLYGAGL